MKKIIRIISIILIILAIITLIILNKNNKIHDILIDETEPKHYINELYKSKEVNYKLVLKEEEKEIYDKIIEGMKNFQNEIKLDISIYKHEYESLYLDEVENIVDLVLMDHPELIHVGSVTISKYRGTQEASVTPNYLISKEEYENNIKEITTIIDKVKIETNNLNEYEKVKYVYDYIGKSNTYGDKQDNKAQSAYSAFNENLSPVCAGYAKASQILLQNIGINSLLISGESEYALFVGAPHAWNIVEIEGKFYLYDVTMSTGATTNKDFYSGFLIGGSKHIKHYKESYPYLNGIKYRIKIKETINK